MEIFCFYAGIALIYKQSWSSLAIILIGFFFNGSKKLIIAFLLGITWAAVHQYHSQDFIKEKVLAKATLIGQIENVSSHGKTVQFELAVEQINQQPIITQVLLNCYHHCPLIIPGERWQFEAKIKRPRNLANPGSFDYQSWAIARHINWQGYINAAKAHKLADNLKTIAYWRYQIAKKLANTALTPQSLGIFEALTLGLTSVITKEQWELFRRTGTTHLMVISGSHISLIALFVYQLIKRLWLLWHRLAAIFPANKVAGISGVISALMYALLSGFSIPTLRAVLTGGLFFIQPFLKNYFTVWQVWRGSLLAVLIIEPHAVLIPGFYLSFAAVAILIAYTQRFACKGFKKFMGLQFACLIGLLPLTLYWFSYGSLTAVLANCIAIPLVETLIVPLSLLALLLLSTPYHLWLCILLNYLIKGLLTWLELIDHLSLVNLNISVDSFWVSVAIILGLLLIIYLPLKALIPAIIFLSVSVLCPYKDTISFSNVKVDILDVGQGLSVVIRTAHHTLVYDTGMQWDKDKDMAKSVIIPYLSKLHINKLDAVVISHPDLDHRGGLDSLQKTYPIQQLIVDNPLFYHQGLNCHQHLPWQWDGVNFRFLTLSKQLLTKNNRSCVLQVESQGIRVLLPGDIEKSAEQYLLSHYLTQLSSNILVLPHHGSKTSSTEAFIKAIAPHYAVVSAGFDNRYHFPHIKTLTTLARYHIKILSTIKQGMISFYLTNHHIEVKTFKKG